MKGFTTLSLSHVRSPRNSFPRAEAGMYQLDEKTLVALQDRTFIFIFQLCRSCGIVFILLSLLLTYLSSYASHRTRKVSKLTNNILKNHSMEEYKLSEKKTTKVLRLFGWGDNLLKSNGGVWRLFLNRAQPICIRDFEKKVWLDRKTFLPRVKAYKTDPEQRSGTCSDPRIKVTLGITG